MNTYADKTQENKSKSVANAVPQKRSVGESTFQFIDNRPEAMQLRKLQEMISNSPQMKQLSVFKEMVNSPQVRQAAQSQKIANNSQQTKQFVDNRPEAIAQRKLQEVMNNSSKTKRLEAFYKTENKPSAPSLIQRGQNNYGVSTGSPFVTIQKASAKQQWDMPGNLKTHIFDGEEAGNNLSGLHSEGRKKVSNGKLRYSEETAEYRNDSKPYGAKVKAKFDEHWSPKNDAYKSSDMFPASWSEAEVIEVIEAAYDSTFKYKPNGETIGRNKIWRSGKWLGNAKGIAIVFAGHPPTTIYPKR